MAGVGGGGQSYVYSHQELVRKIRSQDSQFTLENIEKALSVTGHRDQDTVLKWLCNHKDDPTLNELFQREYVLFLCPTGPFLSEVSKFYEYSYKSCGGNSAHSLFPHIRLTPFFQVKDGLIPYILDALRGTILNLIATQPTKIRLSLESGENFIGLYPDKPVNDWICDLVDGFTENVRMNHGFQIEVKDNQYQLTLAYNFDPVKAEDLLNLARKINLDAPARWEVNVYSRDPRYNGKQFHLVLHNYTALKADELDLRENSFVVVETEKAQQKTWRKGIDLDTGKTGYFPENFARKTAEWRVWSKNFSVPITQVSSSIHVRSRKSVRSQSVNLRIGKSTNPLKLSFRSDELQPQIDAEEETDDYRRLSTVETSTPARTNSVVYCNTTPRNLHLAKSNVEHNNAGRENPIQFSLVASQPRRRLFFMRHAERVDLTFGQDWFKMYIDDKGYHRRNLNLPRRIPTRRNGPKDFLMDGPISEIGTFQAKLIGEALRAKGVSFTAAYCSPSLRCIQTLTSVLEGLGDSETKIKLDPALFEWMAWCRNSLPNFMTAEEYKDYGMNVDLSYEPSFTLSQFNQHERTDEYYHRSHNLIEKVVETFSGNVLMMGHSATLDVCSRQLCGKPIRKPDDLVRVVQKVPFCGLCVVEERADGSWHLIQAPIPSLAHGQNQPFDWKILETTGSTQIPRR